jgi:hypothetical protein
MDNVQNCDSYINIPSPQTSHNVVDHVVGGAPTWDTLADVNLFPNALKINIVTLGIMTSCTFLCVFSLATVSFSETILRRMTLRFITFQLERLKWAVA